MQCLPATINLIGRSPFFKYLIFVECRAYTPIRARVAYFLVSVIVYKASPLKICFCHVDVDVHGTQFDKDRKFKFEQPSVKNVTLSW